MLMKIFVLFVDERGMAMRRRIIQGTAGVVAAVGLWTLAAAQYAGPPTNVAIAGPGAALLGPGQLDQLTAPVALYSDPLLGDVLAAATYPLEIVEAARWLDDPGNAVLRGNDMGAALQQQGWDQSVKSLVAFPDVLRMMSSNLQWTEQLGDAFLAQQADVMDSVQRLRQQAAAKGALQSNLQQTVSTEDQDIAIEPAVSGTVYVPYYVPAVAFAPWPWPDYPPYYFPFPPDIYLGGAVIAFGLGIDFSWPWDDWFVWDWRGHGLRHGPGGRRGPRGPRGNPPGGEPWHHDPGHRLGVPYRDPATSARYAGDNGGARRAFRGYPNEQVPRPSVEQATRAATAGERPLPGQREPAREPVRSAPLAKVRPVEPTRPVPPSVRTVEPLRPSAPAFESFGRGQQVRSEAARGSYSRSSMPAPRAAPSPRGSVSAPRGGNRGRRP